MEWERKREKEEVCLLKLDREMEGEWREKEGKIGAGSKPDLSRASEKTEEPESKTRKRSAGSETIHVSTALFYFFIFINFLARLCESTQIVKWLERGIRLDSVAGGQ